MYSANICCAAVNSERPATATPKKVGALPVAGSDVEKQTNEIKTAAPLLDRIDILGRTITADALLTQRELTRMLVKPAVKPSTASPARQSISQVRYWINDWNYDEKVDVESTRCLRLSQNDAKLDTEIESNCFSVNSP